MKNIVTTLIFLLINHLGYGEMPSWFTDFRDAIYGQDISTALGENFFNEAEQQARSSINGPALYTMLSRCEYLLGKVYQDHNQNDRAAAHYERGISHAENSLKQAVSSGAYEMLAANYGQLCMIKSTAWVMANGLKVLNNARKAIEIDSRNAAALYILASQYAFGPAPFGNPKRGITDLEAILNSSAVLQKEDYFNVYAALGYAHNRLNQSQEALSWTQKSLEIYPTNQFALNLQSEIQQKIGGAR